MTQDELDTLSRLKSYGNLSQDQALEYHRLLNVEEAEKSVEETAPLAPFPLSETSTEVPKEEPVVESVIETPEVEPYTDPGVGTTE